MIPPPHHHPQSRHTIKKQPWIALTAVATMLLVGCGSDESTGPGDTQPSDPWPLSAPPEDPMGWIAEQREPPATSSPTAGASASQAAVTVDVDGTGPGSAYTTAGAGISFEATDLAEERLSADNADLVRILDQMDQPTLRFGGNAVDRRFFYTDSGEPTPTDWPLRDGESITTVTPQDLERLAGLAEATDAHVILSVNLGENDPDRAARLVEQADQSLGDRLVGVMIGNEPNGYALGPENPLSIKDSDWDAEAFQQNWEEYVNAIRAKTPDTRIVGPGAYEAQWWRTVTESGVPNTALAVHQYPLSECGDPEDTGYQAGSAPTIENTVSATTRDRVDDLLGQAVQIADDAQMETWVTETSASSCSGSNDLTETLAAGLYSADYVLRAQHLGVDRIDFHSSLLPCAGGPPMSVVCSSGTLANPGSAFVPRTNGLALALVGSLPAGDFLDTALTPSGSSTTAGSTGRDAVSYAVQHADGSMSVVLIDFRDPQENSARSVAINLPEQIGGATQTTFSGTDFRENYPEATLFDSYDRNSASNNDNYPITADDDGVAMDIRGATNPVAEGRPSVDGYGLPLMPPRLQPEISGVSSGDQVIRTMISPGSVSVISTRPL